MSSKVHNARAAALGDLVELIDGGAHPIRLAGDVAVIIMSA